MEMERFEREKLKVNLNICRINICYIKKLIKYKMEISGVFFEKN